MEKSCNIFVVKKLYFLHFLLFHFDMDFTFENFLSGLSLD